MAHELEEIAKSFDEVETLSELLRIGKDEMNLAEFPMTSLSDRPIKGETTLKFEDQIYDDRKKKLVTRKRVIEGSKEYGLPTATDDAVILGLIQLTKIKNGFASRTVDFTRHELINLLGWANKGQSYDRIEQSLHRVAAVTYHFENSWWDNRRKTWTTKIFGIIDTVELNDSREADGQGGLFPSQIVWNQIVLDSFQAGYLRSIDFRLCMSLKHAISMRIYRFMGKRFHLKSQWTFDLKDFAYEHIGLSRTYEGGTQIVRKLKDAIHELEEVGFLEPLADSKRFVKKGRAWTIYFSSKAPAPQVKIDEAPESSQLVEALSQRGVTKATAEEIVRCNKADLVQVKMDVFDWLTETNDKRIGKNPAGYLVKSIEDDYAIPKGFIPKADRIRLEQSRLDEKREAAQERRRRHEQDAKEKADREAIAAYWASLTSQEQVKLEQAAISQAEPETVEMLGQGPMRRLGIAVIRERYIHQLLKLADEDDSNNHAT